MVKLYEITNAAVVVTAKLEDARVKRVRKCGGGNANRVVEVRTCLNPETGGPSNKEMWRF